MICPDGLDLDISQKDKHDFQFDSEESTSY